MAHATRLNPSKSVTAEVHSKDLENYNTVVEF